MPDPDCVAFLQWALPRMGFRWEGFRRVRRHLCRDVAHRTAELGLANLAAYRAYLEGHDDEWRVLDSMCTVTISRFYRDHGVFDRLRRDVLPAIARAAIGAGERELRAWSAGCASGEEAYTLSIVWHLEVGPRFPELALRVVATDVNDEVLERARRGSYEPNSLRELPPEWREKSFERRGAEWCVRPEMREGIEFRHEDIRERMPEGPLHLVFCRYLVFTYFEPALQRTIAQRLARNTAPFGALVVGSHETVPEDAGWAPSQSSIFFHQVSSQPSRASSPRGMVEAGTRQR
jgi:chemotaxis protein methyltransferase CheR